MKLHLFTICLDSMPFLTWHLPVFNRLTVPWVWSVAEGAAMNVACTSWCAPQRPRLSRDGSSEYLQSLRGHPRVRIHQQESWAGKISMVNACLADFTEPGIVVQIDSDEIWAADQLETLVSFFNAYKEVNSAMFFCRYFVGANIVITSKTGYGNRPGAEWHRAWRSPGKISAIKHEPPIMASAGLCATREQTREVGLVFDHWSWVFAHQVAYKEAFYQYPNALAHWQRLQSNTRWPCDLPRFLPWVGKGVTADLLHKP